MRRAFPVGALIVATALSACGPDLIELSVHGRVSEALSDEPIAGAGVVLTWTRGSFDLEAIGTTTGPDGRYRLFVRRFPCDAPALTAGNGVYSARTRDVPCSESEQELDFELER